MKEEITKSLNDYIKRFDGIYTESDADAIADALEPLIDARVEKLIMERMPTLKEAQDTAYNRCMGLQVNSHGEVSPEPDGFTYMIFIEGTEWFRSRMKGEANVP
jgi:hypothetical protein